MKINYHPVGIKMSEALKSQVEKKLARVTHIFHTVTQVDLFLKVERSRHILELLLQADDEKIYLSQEAGDMYKCLDLLLDRAFEYARKLKSKQHHHRSPMASHHNHLILTKNVASPKDMEEDLDVFSGKPLSRFEAYLELKASGSNLLVFRDGRDNSVNLMLKEKGAFFLIRKERRFLGLFGAKPGFVQYRFDYRGDKFLRLARDPVKVEPMEMKDVLAVVEKQDFCFYINGRSGDFSVMFRYGRKKLGLVEHIEVR
jgi:putative sigma-54 modulation protein